MEIVHLQKQKRIYQIGFFTELIIFLILIVLCIPPVLTDQSPADYYNKRFQKKPVFPISYFLNNADYPINLITPDNNLISAINKNNREIIITFSRPMLTSNNVISSANITYSNRLGKLNFHPFWKSPVLLKIRFNRDLVRGERVAFTLAFVDEKGDKLKPVVLQYE